MDSLTIGKLYLRQGDFKTAREYFEKVIQSNFESSSEDPTAALTPSELLRKSELISNDAILEASLLLGRIAIESQDHLLLRVLLANVQNSSIKNKATLVYQRYLTGLYFFYENRYTDAFQIFLECQSLSREFHISRFQIISLILLIKTALYLNENPHWISATIIELESLMAKTSSVELWTHYYITKASVHLASQSFDEAEKWAICALEKNKEEQDYFLFLAVLILIAEVHVQQNKFELAANGLKIVRSLINPEDMKRMYLKIVELENYIQSSESPRFIFYEQELRIKCSDHTLDLGRQFVLKDLLILFLKNPGVEFSKEEIVRQIWKQDYNPEMHDNLIYVTIRRLRHLLRNESQSQVIQKSKQGYQLNPKIMIEVR